MRRSFLLLWTILLFWHFAMAQSVPNQTRRSSVLDLSAMDPGVDPCVDFYAYSCGGWMKKNPVPADQAAWSVYSKLEDESKIQLRGILEGAAAAGAPRGSVDQKIGDYYASCMDEKAIETKGAKPLQAGLEEINKLSSKAGIADLAARLVNQNILFSFSSDQDYKDSTQVIAEADQGGLGLPDRDYYFMDDAKSADIRKAYVAHVQKMFELLGEKSDAASTDAQSVMRLETQLAKGSMTRLERREPANLYHKLSSEQLQQITPLFPWEQYFKKVGLPSLKSLNVVAPGFFKGMNAELEKEDLGTWKAYLRWKLVHANAMHLSSAFVQENFNFYGKTLTGRQELRPRWKRCTDDVDNDLGEALGQAYAAKHFSPQAKEQALQMVKEIESAMQTDIQSLAWMDQTTKQHALEKLHAVANKIGYPDKWRDYSKLEIVRGDEIGNVLRARQFEFQRQLAKIGKPVDRGEWQMSPPTVNAYYDPQKNDINFPAGILQPPLFSPESDAAPNYGDTGATIGHELTHGFDDEGRQFDAQGNLKDWWSEQDGKEFDKRASCVSDQYSQYTIIDDIKIKGKLTLSEDVADLGGLMLAYMAWKNATQGQTLEPIDGLTPEQRFFIGYGQSWCANERDELKRMRATMDVHSPDKYRTNGVVSNMPQFQQAFHCKPGTQMVRQNSCRVW